MYDTKIAYHTYDGTAKERPIMFVGYEEGIYSGYRFYETAAAEGYFGSSANGDPYYNRTNGVIYPFGYGLSYTTFEYSDAKIAQKNDIYDVTVTIKNTGDREGKEVVELYVAAPDSKAANKPAKELKAFAKTKSLKPGENETLTLSITADQLASFDETASAWVVAEDEYQFLVAASAADVKATLTAPVKNQQVKAHDVLKPQTKMNLLHR
jgi:beta-glucosidase